MHGSEYLARMESGDSPMHAKKRSFAAPESVESHATCVRLLFRITIHFPLSLFLYFCFRF